MSDLARELAFIRHIWWDPGPDGPYGPGISVEAQKQIASISLEVRAATLKAHAEAYSKIASIVASSKTTGH